MERKIDSRKKYALKLVKTVAPILENSLCLPHVIDYKVVSSRSVFVPKGCSGAAGLSFVEPEAASVLIVYDNCHDNHDVLMTLVHELLHVRIDVLKLDYDEDEKLVSDLEELISVLTIK